MTDKPRIRALISRIEAGHVGREESDEYLKILGWEFDCGKGYARAQSPDGKTFGNRYPGDGQVPWPIYDRPHPLADAQAALDSVPKGLLYKSAGSTGTDHGFDLDGHLGLADELAAAICLANLRRLEGG